MPYKDIEKRREASRKSAKRRRELGFKRGPRDNEQAYFWQVKYNYGITREEYLMMLNKQNNSCAICFVKFSSKPDIDHDHKTNKVRGILHRKCNQGIGLLQDSPAILMSAAIYLKGNPYDRN